MKHSLLVLALLVAALAGAPPSFAQSDYWQGSNIFYRAHFAVPNATIHDFDSSYVIELGSDHVGVAGVMVTYERAWGDEVNPGINIGGSSGAITGGDVIMQPGNVYCVALDDLACAPYTNITALTLSQSEFGIGVDSTLNIAAVSASFSADIHINIIYDSTLTPEPDYVDPGPTGSSYPIVTGNTVNVYNEHWHQVGYSESWGPGKTNDLPADLIGFIVEHDGFTDHDGTVTLEIGEQTLDGDETIMPDGTAWLWPETSTNACAGPQGLCESADEFYTASDWAGTFPIYEKIPDYPLGGTSIMSSLRDDSYTYYEWQVTPIFDTFVSGVPTAPPGDEWYKPLDIASEQYLFETPLDPDTGIATVNNTIAAWKDFTVYAQADVSNALVHSIRGGTVTAIRNVSIDDCHTSAKRTDLGTCTIGIKQGEFTYTDYVISLVDFANLQIVRIESQPEGMAIEYLVKDAHSYITDDGGQVAGGCVLGETFEAYNESNPTQTVSMAQARGTDYANNAISIIDLLFYYPDGDDSCSAVTDDTACINRNSTFLNDAEFWMLHSSVTFDNEYGMLELQPGAHISQVLDTLDVTQTYTLNLLAIGAGTLRVGLGTAEETVVFDGQSDLTDVDWYQRESVQITPAPAGALHPLTITADPTNTEPLYLWLACLKTGYSPLGPSSLCYFANPSFNQGLAGWQYAGQVGTNEDGFLMLGNAGQISQHVELFNADGTPAEYTLEIFRAPYLTGEDLRLSSATLEYGMPGLFETSADISNTIAFSDMGKDAGTIRHDFEVAGAAANDFYFRAVINWNDPNNAGFTYIDRVCITAHTADGQFPGYVDPTPNPDDNTCDWPATPRFWSRIDEWIDYLIDMVKAIIECWVVPLLKGIIDWVATVAGYIADGFKWIAAVFAMFISWLGDALGYIGGLIMQLIRHPLIQWIIDKFVDAWQFAIDVIMDIVTKISDFLASIWQSIVTLVTMFVDYYRILTTSWNAATPKPTPGLPNCGTNPDHALCLTVWVMDNTILDDPLLWLSLLLVVGATAFHLVFWTFIEVRKAVVKIGWRAGA